MVVRFCLYCWFEGGILGGGALLEGFSTRMLWLVFGGVECSGVGDVVRVMDGG